LLAAQSVTICVCDAIGRYFFAGVDLLM